MRDALIFLNEVVGAGLPILPERLAEAKSYAERLFVFPDLGALNEAAAWRAIMRPAEVAIPDRPVRSGRP